MNILYLGDSSSWHNALWVKFFCEKDEHNVYLFSDFDKSKKTLKLPSSLSIIHSAGILGWWLNLFGIHSRKLHHLNKVLSNWWFRFIIRRAIKKHNIDIVHCHSLYYGYLGAGIPANIPVVFTPLGSSIIIHAQKPGYYQNMARAAFARADVVTNDSLKLQDMGCKVGATQNNNKIVQFGVDQTIFKPKSSSLRQELNISADELLLFSPRAIDSLYNIDIILDALALLKRQGVVFKCMFTYAFGNENYAKLCAQAEQLGIVDNLVWLGFMQYDEMPEAYNASDIVISVPSSDSSPKSVYEAMSCRKPVVLTELAWSKEILRSGEDFLGVEVRDAKQIAERIVQLNDAPQLLNLIAENGYQQAIKHFGYHDNMQKMEKIMSEAISAKAQ